MNTKNRPRFGGFGVYAMLILLVIILWYTFTNNSTTSDFTQNNLWKAISEEKVVSIRVEQNREVPTGYLNIKLKDGSTERMYTSDVNEIQKELKEKDFIFIKTKSYRNLLATITSVILLQSTFIYNKINSEASSEGIVFNVRKNNLITERNGQKVLIYANDSIINNLA